jgi:omega-6 fatty acid desaturase (delta-12 desaturase)
MLQGKQLILATQKYAVEDRKRSRLHLFITLVIFAIAYPVILMHTPFVIKAIFSIIVGLNIVRMFVIYHDYLHKAIFQKSFLADGLFTLFGLYILAPKSIWKRSHDYHHKHNSKLYTSSIGSFPIVTKDRFLSAKPSERNIYLFIRHPVTIMLGYIFAFAYGMCIGSFLSNKEKHWDSVISLTFHYGIGALIWIFFGFKIFLLAFMIPAFISGGMGAYLFYAQHNFPSATFKEKDGWTYTDAALDSSSYMVMNPIMQFFTANIGYHHIHHINARIPFYKLPEVYNDMPEFQAAKRTSLNPAEILRCLKLKVWDSVRQKMIGLKEM